MIFCNFFFVVGTPLQNKIQDFGSIVEWLSRNRDLSGYSADNVMKWERKPNPENGDVENLYPFMIRQLLKNYEKEVEKRTCITIITNLIFIKF